MTGGAEQLADGYPLAQRCQRGRRGRRSPCRNEHVDPPDPGAGQRADQTGRVDLVDDHDNRAARDPQSPTTVERRAGAGLGRSEPGYHHQAGNDGQNGRRPSSPHRPGAGDHGARGEGPGGRQVAGWQRRGPAGHQLDPADQKAGGKVQECGP
ncbi:MAG: hypothetical protein ACRD0D_14985, partial [Acidimicrobiales bacterium]